MFSPPFYIFTLIHLFLKKTGHRHVFFKVKQYSVKKYAAKIVAVMSIFSYGFSFGNVHANYSTDKSQGCPTLQVNFTNLSSSGTTCHWDFGNGNTSTLVNPSALFSNSGTYRVVLIITNGSQTDSFSKTIVVFTPPTANFTVNKPTACLGDTILFQNLANSGSAAIVSYTWDFGNGLAGNLENTSYQYLLPGTYNITLVVRDSNQCSGNKTTEACVQIYPVPHASFSANPQNSCNSPQTVQFTNNSIGNGLNYLWALDSNAISTVQNPSYTYSDQSYGVKLAVTDTNGCKNRASRIITVMELHAGFTASNTHPCTGMRITFRNTSDFAGTQWYWDFGDGTTSNLNNPSKTYTQAGNYTVNFILNDGNCMDSIKRTSYINVISGFSAAAASFSADTTFACSPPLLVNFYNTTPGINQSQYDYHWTFGDSIISDLQNPMTVYNHDGSYTVSLTIKDSISGCEISSVLTNYIKVGPPVPKALIDTINCPGAPVSFKSISLNTATVLWRFGDGDSSALPQTTHVYNHSGYYTVMLTAHNPAGCDSTIVLHNYVHILSISSNFTMVDSFSTCPPFVASFYNLTSRQGNRFLWDFGDGFTDTTYNSTHVFFHPGVYTVKLITTSTRGYCTDTVTRPHLITVQGPRGNFTIDNLNGCAPLTVNFLAAVSIDTKTISCDLGDGTIISDSIDFNHVYLQPRIYRPEFILTDYVGCRVAYSLPGITVNGLPVLNSFDTSVCLGADIHVLVADGSNSYNWTPSSYISCDTCGDVTINALRSTMYIVTATGAGDCKNTATVNVLIKLPPVLNDSLLFTLCPQDTCSLFVGNATKFSWMPALYLNDTNAVSPLCTPLASTLYTVSARNSNGCVATAQVQVNIKDNISVTIADSILACPEKGQILQPILNGNYQDLIQYSWSPAQYLNNSDISSPVATIYDTPVQFQLIVSNGHCMADTEYLTVYPDVPTLQVSPSITTYPEALVWLSATSSEMLHYNWWATDKMYYSHSATASVRASTSQMVYVEGKNATGCVVKDSVQIIVLADNKPEIFIPNAFTPNGDGTNDCFEVHGNGADAGYFEVLIFNRWGEQVFASNSFNFKWDGTYKGKPEPPAIYTYKMQLAFNDGKPGTMKIGTVTLLR